MDLNDQSTGADAAFMRRALALARRGEGRTSPNPMVGAVLVSRGAVVGEGWHRAAGTPHAEVHALQAAGDEAKGSTLYVTLEPCSHHGRTPPCTDAVVTAGVERVVVAMLDPDGRVAGRGAERLREAGIAVDTGVLEQEARRVNEAYIVHRTLGRPFVTCKAAITLDGRTAAADGSSQWITGAEARRDVHRLRARSDAVVAGIGTVLADDPSLTVRDVPLIHPGRPPLRVVVDTRARTPLRAKVLLPETPTLVVTAAGADPGAVAQLQAAGADVLGISGPRPGSDFGSDFGGRVPIPAMLAALGTRGIVSLLLEGGATLAGAFVAAGCVDRFVFYVAPKLLGAPGTHGAVEGWAAASMDAAASLEIESVRRFGDDLRIIARPRRGTT
jgi:diaminohydroxyphosphoribosylaminopyrimidine deaminase/5-amino-6-(5-phosphoribosylamino)uracil reductase